MQVLPPSLAMMAPDMALATKPGQMALARTPGLALLHWWIVGRELSNHGESGRSDLWGCQERHPVGAENVIRGSHAASLYSWMTPGGAENVIRVPWAGYSSEWPGGRNWALRSFLCATSSESCGCQESHPRHATRWYSWMSPPRRSVLR